MHRTPYAIPNYPNVVCTHCGKTLPADKISSHRCERR
jgi:hypothetical protein